MLKADVNQTLLRGGQRLALRDVDRALQMCVRVLQIKRSARISIAFVTEREMRALNRQWRGKDRVTDVLSFALSDPKTTPSSEPFGELILCYPQAKRQAEEMGHSVRDELLFLLVHGVLHLYGHDHEQPAEAKRMFGLQKRALSRLHIDPTL